MGHVLDEYGQKMSKHKGNVLDPWIILNEQGADAMRWYLFTTSPPWYPSRFYQDAVIEAQRKFLNTLWNVYSFFVLYANIDGFNPKEYEMAVEDRTDIDKWIISRLNNTIKTVRTNLDNYNITPAARAIDDLVDDISNWYLRRSRSRYWKSETDIDKIAAYLTLYETLVATVKLAAPFIPFISEAIYRNLVRSVDSEAPESVHFCDYPIVVEEYIDNDLERDMEVVRKVVNLGRSARNRSKIKNRQPLSKMYIKLKYPQEKGAVLREDMNSLIKEELNVKEICLVDDVESFVSYKIKPRYDVLGPKHGKLMSKIAKEIAEAEPANILDQLEKNDVITLDIAGETVEILKDELEIKAEDAEGFCAEGDYGYYAVLDITITEDLELEGLARELISKIQNLRKEAGFEVENRINLYYQGDEKIDKTIDKFNNMIASETLSVDIENREPVDGSYSKEMNINGYKILIGVKREE